MQALRKYINSFILLPLIIINSLSVSHDEPVNYYGIATTQTFDEKDYKLSWSSHPNANYYKQEYLPSGQSSETFNDMMMIEFIQSDITVYNAVLAQVNTLNERKKTDAICNFQVIGKKGGDGKRDSSDYILDFVLSQNYNTKQSIIEWNGYHYKSYTDSAGHKGVLLFAISRRAYGNGVKAFLTHLSDSRKKVMPVLTSYILPQIQVK